MNCVVVPIYKDFYALNEIEIKSISQLYKILYKHSIYLVGPEKLDWNAYVNDAKTKGINILVINFNELYFKDISGYNSLLLSGIFYNSFIKHQHILIYQLDAFIFKDELDFWCEKRYDYIGAPWFEDWSLASVNSKITGAGNGGFSLRKVSSSIKLLKRIKFLKNLKRIWYKSYFLRVIKFESYISLANFFFKIKNYPQLHNVLLNEWVNEDVFWAQRVGAAFHDFEVAGTEDARKFSFEVNPSLLFKQNSYQLPFGCHAWEKYEPEFWNNWILKPDKNL